MSKQEDFGRPEKPLEKTREIDNEARISKKAEMKRKFNRNQKQITLWDIQLSSLTSLLNILRFFAEVSTKLKKSTFFDNFRIITQEENMKTTQMTPFFYLLFLLYLLVTFISEFENTLNSFSNSLLRSILVYKIPQFFSKSYWFGQLIILFQKVDNLKSCFVYPLEQNTHFFSIQLMDYIGGWRKFHTELVCIFLTFLVTKNSF